MNNKGTTIRLQETKTNSYILISSTKDIQLSVKLGEIQDKLTKHFSKNIIWNEIGEIKDKNQAIGLKNALGNKLTENNIEFIDLGIVDCNYYMNRMNSQI